MAADAVDTQKKPTAISTSPALTTLVVPIRWTIRGDDHRGDGDRHRDRERAQAGLERRVAADELEVLGDEEDEAEEGEERGGDRRARRGEPPVAEDAHREHRVLDPQLPRRRSPTSEDGGGTEADQRRPGSSHPHSGASMIVNTSVPIAAIDRIRPRQSSVGASASRDSGTSSSVATNTIDDDRHVDEEHRAPPVVLEQPAADDRPGGDGDAAAPRSRCRWPSPARRAR